MEKKSLLENFKIKSLNEKNDKESDSFIFTGLPNEFAITLGNYLRRILLSYIDGIAIIGVKIGNDHETAKSEFSTLGGLVETIPYFILNLKNLVLKPTKESLESSEIFQLFIEINNESSDEYTLTGKDIKTNRELVEVFNPDIYLATVSPKSTLKVVLYCRSFWGFKKNSEQKPLEEENDLIIIDSNYNPVKNVSFRMNLVVVDLDSQEEQLVLDIKTNGSVTPKEALMNALNISENINQSLLNKLNLD